MLKKDIFIGQSVGFTHKGTKILGTVKGFCDQFSETHVFIDIGHDVIRKRFDTMLGLLQ